MSDDGEKVYVAELKCGIGDNGGHTMCACAGTFATEDDAQGLIMVLAEMVRSHHEQVPERKRDHCPMCGQGNLTWVMIVYPTKYPNMLEAGIAIQTKMRALEAKVDAFRAKGGTKEDVQKKAASAKWN